MNNIKSFNLEELFKSIHEDIELSSAKEIKQACSIIIKAQKMNGAERDTLRALFNRGPLYDGDVPSKSARNELIAYGLACQVIVKGEDGYTACTYEGLKAYRILEAST